MGRKSTQYIDPINDAILGVIVKLMGNKETGEDELRAVGKKLFPRTFNDVTSFDRYKDKWGYHIVNVDPSFMGGSHWVAIVRTPKDTLIYDSFGRKTSKIMPELITTGQIIDSEYDAEQGVNEDNCGQRCISALIIYDQLGKKAFLDL